MHLVRRVRWPKELMPSSSLSTVPSSRLGRRSPVMSFVTKTVWYCGSAAPSAAPTHFPTSSALHSLTGAGGAWVGRDSNIKESNVQILGFTNLIVQSNHTLYIRPQQGTCCWWGVHVHLVLVLQG